MPDVPLDKNALDVAQIFQTYMAFGGDVDKTAVACNEDRETILALEQDEHWKAKIEQLNRLTNGDGKELQVQINRAVNYAQSHRIRSIVDKVVSHLSKKTAEELVNLFTKTGRDGASEFSSRPLADLVKAAETCQAMTQRALGDTVAERPEEAGTSGKNSKAASISLAVMAAMSAADSSGLNSVELVRKELAAPAVPAAMGG